DGIRDFHVTGVQTCALPIFDRQGIEEGIDQIGLAPADAPPEIQTLYRYAALGTKLAEQADAARRTRFENLVVEPLQMPDCIFLRRIMEKVRTLEVRLIAFKRRHAGWGPVKNRGPYSTCHAATWQSAKRLLRRRFQLHQLAVEEVTGIGEAYHLNISLILE